MIETLDEERIVPQKNENDQTNQRQNEEVVGNLEVKGIDIQQDKELYDNLEESVLAQLYEEREKFQKQLADISKQLKELEKENKELKENNKKIASQEQEANDVANNEKDIINSTLDNFLKENLNKPEITEGSIEDKLQALFTYVKGVEIEYKNLVDSSNEKQQNDDLQKEKTELKDQISKLEKEKINLEQDKKVFEDLVNELKKKEAEYKEKYDAERKSFEDYRNQYSRSFDIDNYINAYDTAKFEDIKIENERLEKDVEYLKKQLKDKVIEINDLTKDKGNLQGQLTEKEKQNKKLEDKNRQYFIQIT